jgi:protein-L-isoaspartate(D-aspartate) O-methyltransferase
MAQAVKLTWSNAIRWLATLIGGHLLLLGYGGGTENSLAMADPDRQSERAALVDHDVIVSGVRNAAVLAAMRKVPRHRFVPEAQAAWAYEDTPLAIGYGQTVSQPSLVASMVEALELRHDEKVLEIGTGSGYQAAILAEIVDKVFTIEIVEPLANRAAGTLVALGYHNVRVRVGDGYQGWAEEAPFDAIIVTAAPDHVPQPLLEQLAIGGRLILPLGRFMQQLVLIRRTEEAYDRTGLISVRFVPMTGKAEHGASGQ